MSTEVYFCPKCGIKLAQMNISPPIWLKVYRCQNTICDRVYVKVLDLRNDYGLIESLPDVDKRINSLPKDSVKTAWLKIKFVDCKTVSILEFENYLLTNTEP